MDRNRQRRRSVVSETQQHLLARESKVSLLERNSTSSPKKPNSECICHKTDKRKTQCRKEVGERVREERVIIL